jgi:hypothetical protein
MAKLEKQVWTQITETEHENLRELSERTGMTVSGLIRKAIKKIAQSTKDPAELAGVKYTVDLTEDVWSRVDRHTLEIINTKLAYLSKSERIRFCIVAFLNNN